MRRLWKSDRGCLHTTSIWISSSSNRPEPCAWMIVRLIRRFTIGIAFILVEILCKALSHCPWFIMSVVCGDIESVAAAAFWMMIFGAEGGGGFTAGGLPCGGVLVKMMNILACSWFASLITLLQVPASSARGCTPTRKDPRCFIYKRRIRSSASFVANLSRTVWHPPRSQPSRCKWKCNKHHNSDITISWKRLVIDYYTSVLHTKRQIQNLGGFATFSALCTKRPFW